MIRHRHNARSQCGPSVSSTLLVRGAELQRSTWGRPVLLPCSSTLSGRPPCTTCAELMMCLLITIMIATEEPMR
jgi:hypothetical protein